MLIYFVQLVWFLAPHVALADQQHNVLAKYLPGFQTRLLTGADGVEHWSEQRIWDEVLYNVRIVVSTYQVTFYADTLKPCSSYGKGSSRCPHPWFCSNDTIGTTSV